MRRVFPVAACALVLTFGGSCRRTLIAGNFATGALHGPCKEDGSCSEGRCLETRSSRSCELSCTSASDCPAGMACSVSTDWGPGPVSAAAISADEYRRLIRQSVTSEQP